MSHPRNYYKDEENVFKESRKFSSRTEFKKKSHRAYDVARELNLLGEMPWLDNPSRKPKGYWKKKDNVMNEARKYKTKDEFMKSSPSAFLAAHRYGYIDDMDWLVIRKQNKRGHWNYDNIKNEAIKYQTKTEFKKKSPYAYEQALKLGIIDDFFMNDYVEYL